MDNANCKKTPYYTIDLLPFNKYLSENIFSRYFSSKNESVARLCTNFLRKLSKKSKFHKGTSQRVTSLMAFQGKKFLYS